MTHQIVWSFDVKPASVEAFDHEAFRAEYQALDARCQELTEHEQLVGDFETKES